MSIQEDIEKVENKMKEIENESWAMLVLKDYKKTNKRMFIIWIITFLALVGLSCYTIYLLNDISSVETTSQEVEQESDNGNNNFIGGNGDINNGKTKNKANNN